MSISEKLYVNITSSVGGAAAIQTRQLIGRLFTNNPLLPTGAYIEFISADDVGAYFGTTSQEYLRALFYFGWVSKNGTAPQKISFARWTDVDTAPLIFGAPGAQAIGTWNAITAGSFSLTIAGTSNTMSGLNFSGAANLAAVAAIIQAAIRTKTGTMWTAATVTYDAVRGCFNFAGGVTGVAAISVQAGAGGSDIAAQLGWLSPNTILSNGLTAKTVSQALAYTSSQSNNFGSFLFMPALTQSQIVEAASWNKTQNVMFMYTVASTTANVAALQAALAQIGGTTITLSDVTNEFPEMCPMMILAATDYSARNSVQNYEFNQFILTPSVTSDTNKTLYDGLNVNYIGQTQEAGRLTSFYQNGVMQGLPVDPADQNTYANEMWFKDQAAADILTAQLTLPQIPANDAGRLIILSVLQADIDMALRNGTFSPGKTFTANQKNVITNITGDPEAWRQVVSNGYWVDVQIVPIVVNNITKYKAVYTLVYGKDDVIRLVEGRDILI